MHCGTREGEAVAPLPTPRSSTAHLDLRGTVPVAVVDVAAWLDVATAPAVEELLRGALASRPVRVAVDLSRCEGADAYGLGVLARVQRDAAAQGTELVLTGVNRRVRRVLGLLQLSGDLPVVAEPAQVAS